MTESERFAPEDPMTYASATCARCGQGYPVMSTEGDDQAFCEPCRGELFHAVDQ